MSAQQGSSASPSLGRRTYQKGLQTLVWRADDENDDELSYDVQYRREGETAWKTLRRDVTEPILVWDTTTVPNGTYFVRIVASDAPSNAADTALTGELDSAAFEIDNTAPDIAVQHAEVDAGRTIVTFDVTDDHSPIQRVECSQDGSAWRPRVSGGRHRRLEVRTLRGDDRRRAWRARPEPARHRRDEQRRDDAGLTEFEQLRIKNSELRIRSHR